MSREQYKNSEADSANAVKNYTSVDQLIYRTNFIIGTGDEYNAPVVRSLTQLAFSLGGINSLAKFASHS